jgi:hypothetical protein
MWAKSLNIVNNKAQGKEITPFPQEKVPRERVRV